MTLDLNGRWMQLINPNTLQGAGVAWPVEIVLRSMDLMGLLDVEFIDNGDAKGAIAVTKIIYEASATPSVTPGEVLMHDGSSWVAATQELLGELLADVGQVQSDWAESDSNEAAYIANRPPDVTTETFLAKTASRILINGEVWAALEPYPLSISGSAIAVDLTDGIDFTLDMTENAQLSNFTNKTVGQRGIIQVTQDATGNRLITFATGEFEFVGETAFTLSTGANDVDEIAYRVITDTKVRLSIDKNWGTP